jgi:hypothetical protein
MYGSIMEQAPQGQNETPLLQSQPPSIIDPSKFSEDEDMVRQYGASDWHVTWYRYLHRRNIILLLAFLMLIDISILMTILILEGAYPSCEVVLSLCECQANTCTAVCKDPPVSVVQAVEALNVCSLLIISLFLVEASFQVVLIGLKRFVFHPFLILDLVILLVSLGIEVWVMVLENTEAAEAQAVTIPLLIFSRSWRLLRIGTTIVIGQHEVNEERIQDLELEVASLKRRLEGSAGSTAALNVN